MLKNKSVDIPTIVNILKVVCSILFLIVVIILAPSVLLSYLVHIPFIHSLILWLVIGCGLCIIISSIISLLAMSTSGYRYFVCGDLGKWIYVIINVAAIILSAYVCIKFYIDIPILYGTFKLLLYCIRTLLPMIISLILIRTLNKNIYRARRKRMFNKKRLNY